MCECLSVFCHRVGSSVTFLVITFQSSDCGNDKMALVVQRAVYLCAVLYISFTHLLTLGLS